MNATYRVLVSVVISLVVFAATSGCSSYDRQEAIALVEKLGSKDNDEFRKTIEALGKMGDGPADLVIGALKDESHQRRIGAMQVIASWDGLIPRRKKDWGEDYVPPAPNLTRALAHDDVTIRYQAAILLRLVSWPRVWPKALPVLQQAANDATTETYNLPVLTAYAVGDKVSNIYIAEKVSARTAAIGALWDMQLPEGSELILNALKSPDKSLIYELRGKLQKGRDGLQRQETIPFLKQLETELTTAEAKLGLPAQPPSSQ